MEVFDNWAQKYYKRPKKIISKDSDVIKIDWDDFNYPSFYPLFHYNIEEINDKDKDGKAFMSVSSFEFMKSTPTRVTFRFLNTLSFESDTNNNHA